MPSYPTTGRPTFRETWQWWSERRLRYNLALFAAGACAFILYAAVVWSFQERLPQAEITLFTIIVQGIGFLCAVLVANVCYLLGPLAERVVAPGDVERFRLSTYRLGFWFSVALPFLIPALVLFAVVDYDPSTSREP
jgi:hypothetical protein